MGQPARVRLSNGLIGRVGPSVHDPAKAASSDEQIGRITYRPAGRIVAVRGEAAVIRHVAFDHLGSVGGLFDNAGGVYGGTLTRFDPFVNSGMIKMRMIIMANPKISIKRGLPLLVILMLAGCLSVGRPAKERDFGAANLFLPLSALPEGWKEVGEIRPMGPESAIGVGDPDDAFLSYSTRENKFNVATYYVYWNATTGGAERWFERTLKTHFSNNRVSVAEPWSTPDELSYRSPYADRFHAACFISEIIERRMVCDVIAQYEEFGVEFHSVVGGDDTLSLNEFNSAVCQIDALFVARLGLSEEPVDCSTGKAST